MDTPAALLDLSRSIVHAFGWQPAKSRTGSAKAVGTGPQAGRVLYGKKAEAALAAPAKPKTAPARKPAAKAPARPAPATAPAAASAIPTAPVTKVTPRGTRITLHPYKRPTPVPATPSTPAPPPPPPPPEAVAAADSHVAADTRRFGPKAAGVLKKAFLELGRAALATLGAAGGAAIGGLAGWGLSGGNPLGAVAGAIGGGALGINALTGIPRQLQSLTRLRAGARKVARKVVPGAVGTAVGTAAAVPVIAGTAKTVSALGAVAPALSYPIGVAAAGLGVGAAKLGVGAANATRRVMATSRVSARRAEGVADDALLSPAVAADISEQETERRRKKYGYAESFADTTTINPIALLRARLKALFARLGKPCPEMTDADIQKVLAGAAG